MTEALVDTFLRLRVWTRGQEPAPHKPLLVLYALGQLHCHKRRVLTFKEVDDALPKLLAIYGSTRTPPQASYPFWRLQHDGVWTVTADSELQPRASNTDPKRSELLSKNAKGGFVPDICDKLLASPELVNKVAEAICKIYMPNKDRSQIFNLVGLPNGPRE